ncbi:MULTISPECIES: ATP-binding protein [Methanobrevibacter]|uniref:AAA ATPase-like protein n=1 Tax=Methanobrevibacter gottschalkii DSM 11977 TaxID=1122229 RepID=A0A3N5BMT4_9EURY|nr:MULTISPECIES: ATP-binding protein [Methanobrevibacter]RPF51008.1 AAA ATPase-like protein [Methanobrevibacter gottschalkii DSM 11977]
MMNIETRESLFQPGQPVSADRFKGREEIIEEILKYFPSVKSGNPHHFFITGKRGMGKTSLANFISDFANKNYSMITAHIMNDGVHSIDELIVQIIEGILNSIKSEKWSEKIFGFLEDHIESVGLGGMNIKFKPSNQELKNIKDNFAFYLSDLVNNFKDKDGLFIVIDDINGLSETPDFANWYKSFVDTLATSVDNAPICIMLTGYPEKFIKLHEQNPSVNRIFHVHELNRLDDDEIKNFYTDIFLIYDINVEGMALEAMTKYSSGMPTMMQEIGDATFWSDTDGFIDREDAFKGIIEAGNRIGLKYLQPLLDQKIRSENYLSLFKKIGNELAASPNSTFTKKTFSDVLNDNESKVFKDFISRAKKLGIIELASSKKQGEYQFTNQLYPMYFMIQTFKEEAL